MDAQYRSSSERAAEILAASLAGAPPDDHARRNLLRQLCDRLAAWVAMRPPAAAGWRAIAEAPRERRHELVELLARLTADDVVARYLVERLAPRQADPQPRRIDYRDFVVAIEAAAGGSGLAARLVTAPYGDRGIAPIDLGFCGGHPAALIRSLARGMVLQRNVRRVAAAAAPSRVEELGRQLGNALFVGCVREAWIASMGLLAGRPELGLRLRLLFDLRRRPWGAVAALPWELLRDPTNDQVLCKNVRTPLVRSLEVAGVAVAAAGAGTPAAGDILLIRSHARDHPQLDLAAESLAIEGAWRSLPGVRVEAAAADLAGLRNLLRSRPFAVLHFMGHGDFDRRAQSGLLVFEDAAGGSLAISASTLVEQLSGLALRLVVLSACRSGELPRLAGMNPFAGVASALIRSGSPAVLAMQLPISDPAAILFARELYRRLAVGDDIEAAVAEGRLAISRGDPESAEWATPVLYLQGDGPRFR